MPSKVLEEFLKKASPEAKASLQQIGQELKNSGAEDKAPQSPAPPQPAATVAERPDVKQIGQALQRNEADLNEATHDPQPLARRVEARPHAEMPKFMDEQRPDQQPGGQTMTPDQKAALQQYEQKTERSGQQNQPQPKQNAVDRANAPSQKAPEPPKSQDKQKSTEIER